MKTNDGYFGECYGYIDVLLIYIIGVLLFVFHTIVIRTPKKEGKEFKIFYIFLLISVYFFIIALKIFVY